MKDWCKLVIVKNSSLSNTYGAAWRRAKFQLLNCMKLVSILSILGSIFQHSSTLKTYKSYEMWHGPSAWCHFEKFETNSVPHIKVLTLLTFMNCTTEIVPIQHNSAKTVINWEYLHNNHYKTILVNYNNTNEV